MQLEELAREVFVRIPAVAQLVVEVVQHRRALRHRFEEAAEVTQHMLVDHVAVVVHEHGRHPVVSGEHAEMVGPEVREELLEWPLAVYSAQPGGGLHVARGLETKLVFVHLRVLERIGTMRRVELPVGREACVLRYQYLFWPSYRFGAVQFALAQACIAKRMARKSVPLQAVFPYHVTSRCINRDWFRVPMADVWQIMGDQLYFVHHAYGVKVIAFVLMDNHFHLIIQTPNSNLGDAMRWFMRETSRALTWAGNRENQTYGGRFFRSILCTDLYFHHAYKYVFLNPVRAGLVDQVLDYPFSTLPCVLGIRPLIFPVFDEVLLPSVEDTLAWLNRIPDRESWDSVRKALRRREFQLPKKKKAPHRLESEPF